MNRNILRSTCLALAMAGNLFAAAADIDGAKAGQWTMDLDAAKTLAAEKKLPILLDFTGSDWCKWCILMESNVFTKAEWKAYAKDNVVMVLLDFPQDETLVPEKYKKRNESLAEEFKIEGFPTYVILDDDGKTELGRLGAGEETTPESFIKELKELFQNRPAEMAKFAESLSPEKKAEFKALTDKLGQTKQQLEAQVKILEAQSKILEEANDKAMELDRTIAMIEGDLRAFHLEQSLSAEELKAFKDLKAKYDAAIVDIEEWIEADPEQTDANMAIFEAMREEIMKLREQLSKY